MSNTVQGYPNLSQDKYAYIEKKYAQNVMDLLHADTCLMQIASSDPLDEIKEKGDTIHIGTIPRIRSKKYNRGQTLDFDTAAADAITLKVDRARYFTQTWDRLDLHQTHLKMLEAETAQSAMTDLMSDIEEEFFPEIGDMPHADNVGNAAGAQSHIYKLGTAQEPFQLTAKNSAAYITQFFSVMAEQKITQAQGAKSIVIPEWARHYLVNNEQFSNASKSGRPSTLFTNKIGSIGGVDVYTSTLLQPIAAANNPFPFFACTKRSLAFLVALKDLEVVKPSNMFASVSKGLVLYDWGVVRPEGIALGYAYAGDTSILAA